MWEVKGGPKAGRDPTGTLQSRCATSSPLFPSPPSTPSSPSTPGIHSGCPSPSSQVRSLLGADKVNILSLPHSLAPPGLPTLLRRTSNSISRSESACRQKKWRGSYLLDLSVGESSVDPTCPGQEVGVPAVRRCPRRRRGHGEGALQGREAVRCQAIMVAHILPPSPPRVATVIPDSESPANSPLRADKLD